MATISNKREFVVGDKRLVSFDVTFSTIATGGESVTAANLGLQSIDIMLIAPVSGKEFTYNASTAKIMAFQSPAYGTVSGTIDTLSGVITTTAGDITIVGGSATGPNEKLWLSTDTATGELGKEGTGALAIPQATFGIPVETAALSTGPVFTNGAAASQAALAEVTGSIAVTTRCLAIGV